MTETEIIYIIKPTSLDEAIEDSTLFYTDNSISVRVKKELRKDLLINNLNHRAALPELEIDDLNCYLAGILSEIIDKYIEKINAEFNETIAARLKTNN